MCSLQNKIPIDQDAQSIPTANAQKIYFAIVFDLTSGSFAWLFGSLFSDFFYKSVGVCLVNLSTLAQHNLSRNSLQIFLKIDDCCKLAIFKIITN